MPGSEEKQKHINTKLVECFFSYVYKVSMQTWHINCLYLKCIHSTITEMVYILRKHGSNQIKEREKNDT